jgi:hypothetical protein
MKQVKVILIIVIAIVVSALYYCCQPKENTHLRDRFAAEQIAKDSLLDGRHAGYIDLEKFKDLALKTKKFEEKDIVHEGDSIRFIVKDPLMIYGVDERGKNWQREYKNFPARIDKQFFKVKTKKENGRIYIYLPYQILFNLINSVGIEE